jgi:hypothetical protein
MGKVNFVKAETRPASNSLKESGKNLLEKAIRTFKEKSSNCVQPTLARYAMAIAVSKVLGIKETMQHTNGQRILHFFLLP